jgi:murein DD-endopeptidase MepM/ murein hydrolase activator NlpD
MKRLLMTSYFFIFVALTLFSFKVYSKEISEGQTSSHLHSTNDDSEQKLDGSVDETKTEPQVPEAPPEPIETWEDYTIRRGDTLSSILQSKKISTPKILAAAKDIYDLSKIRMGKKLEFLQHRDYEIPIQIKYRLGEDEILLISRDPSSDSDQSWTAKKDITSYDSQIGYRKFVVQSTLWEAATKAGLRPADIAAVAKVLEYDLDFNTEIRAGATAEILIEELYLDGAFQKLGTPLAVIFTNKKEDYHAFHYVDKKGNAEYYDSKGLSRKSAFLRSPLAFNARVTSSFNPKRFHPISKKVRPHNGTDFGAPTGTPIRSVAAGTVVFASRNGGHGNFVKIVHQSPYKTSYSHLSKISVKKGQKVKQGQIIGKVGSTGASTGPHLHYQVWKNNKYVDAMTEKMPRTQKLSSSELKNFKRQKESRMKSLDDLRQLAISDRNEISKTDQ